MTDLAALLRALSEAGVEFVLVGGVAATVHGSARLTQDVDVVYRRSTDNHDRIARALTPFHPYLRGVPPGLPFVLDPSTLAKGLNFTLTTDIGDIDLLGEIAGGGAYEALMADAIEVDAFGITCACIGLERLIATKRAAGRPRDLEAIAELEALREESGRDS